MRSLLRDVVEQAHAARNDLFFAWLAFAAFTIGGCTAAHGDEPYMAKARAALALAKAKRERESMSCFADYDAAVAAARRFDKHLVLWVGMKCSDHPGLRRDLADAIHCHLPAQHGDRTPRVVIEGANGIEWYVRAERIGPDTVRKIRGSGLDQKRRCSALMSASARKIRASALGVTLCDLCAFVVLSTASPQRHKGHKKKHREHFMFNSHFTWVRHVPRYLPWLLQPR